MNLYAVNVLWSVSTLLGLVLALYLAKEGYLDLKALQVLKTNGDKRTLAVASVAAGLVGALGQLFLFLIVIPSFLTERESPFTVLTALLIMGSWCLTAKTAITVWANKRVQG